MLPKDLQHTLPSSPGVQEEAAALSRAQITALIQVMEGRRGSWVEDPGRSPWPFWGKQVTLCCVLQCCSMD